jgi:acetyl-CoA acetyltransferase
VPVTIPQRKGDPIIIDTDEHPRASTTLEALAKLKAVVKADGTVTAGNASGINDGAAALLIASDEAIAQYQLKPVPKSLQQPQWVLNHALWVLHLRLRSKNY